jgi:hypothetical protein
MKKDILIKKGERKKNEKKNKTKKPHNNNPPMPVPSPDEKE